MRDSSLRTRCLRNLAVPSERHMKKKSKEEIDDLRPEYDLRELLKSGVQGKYADRYREGTNLALLEHDVAEEPATKGSGE